MTERATIDRYLVHRALGRGATGIVYVATDPQLERDIALKVLHVDAPAERMRSQAKALARLAHPNVIRVYDVGDAGGELFVTMELVDGEPLPRWLASPRSVREICNVLVQAGQGLVAAHAAGIIHGNLTASDVLVARGGDALLGGFASGDAAVGDDDRAYRDLVRTTLGARTPRAVAEALPSASLTELLVALTPRRRRWPWIAGAALGLAAAAGGVLALRSGEAAVDCSATAAEMDATWTPDIERQLRERDAASATDLARYAQDWKRARVAACTATHVDATQSREVLGKRVACLEQARLQLASTTSSLLTSATDPSIVLAVLPSVERCATSLMLSTPDRADAAAILGLEAEVSRAELMFTGQVEVVELAAVDALVARAEKLGDGPLELRVRILRALVASRLGDDDRAISELRTAMARTEREGNDGQRAFAGAFLARILAPRDADGAARVASDARAALARAGSNVQIDKKLHAAEVEIALARSAYADAVRHQQAIIELIVSRTPYVKQELANAYHLLQYFNVLTGDTEAQRLALAKGIELEQEIADASGNAIHKEALANNPTVALEAGQFEEALRRANRLIALFSSNPDVPPILLLHSRSVRAQALELLERYAECVAEHRALVRETQALMSDKRQDLAELRKLQQDSLVGSAGCADELGRRDEAIADYRKALELTKSTHADIPYIQRLLGGLLVRVGSYAEARSLLEPLPLPPAPLPRARLLAGLAEALWRLGDPEDKPRALALLADAEIALADPSVSAGPPARARLSKKSGDRLRAQIAAWKPET